MSIYFIKKLLVILRDFFNYFWVLLCDISFETKYIIETAPFHNLQISSFSKIEKLCLVLNSGIIVLIISPFIAGSIILVLSKLISNEKVMFITFFWSSISLSLLFFYFYAMFWDNTIFFVKISDFIYLSDFNISLDFVVDQVTFVMMFVVVFISYMVINFSHWYMAGDPNLSKFTAFINFFSFFMLILVAANNLILIFVGWEGIGMFSYLLINFWSTRLNANRSALKALVVNKVGDCCFYIFIFLYFFIFETFNLYDAKFLVLPYLHDSDVVTYSTIICSLVFFLMLACMAKSAQIIMHVWLPDAMEGPTPVSALLHAATMVTAGIYVLIKFNWLIFFDESIYHFIILVGVLTNLLASLSSVFQLDIKKIIAYSTASQLGLIFIAYGTLKFNLALFHIFNHSFFKALLFILAGVLIHNLKNKQDLRAMFLFKSNIFSIYAIFFISSLTLIGFPFLSAFYSKDFIIQNAFINISVNKSWLIFFLKVSVATTIIYTFRIMHFLFMKSNVKTFDKSLKMIKNKFYILEDVLLSFVLYSLSIFSVFIGYFTSAYFQNDFFTFSSNLNINLYIEKTYVINSLEFSCFVFFYFLIVVTPLIVFELIFVKYFLFFSKYENIFFFFNKKTLFDNLYFYFCKYYLSKLNLLFLFYDKVIIEYFIAWMVKKKNTFIKKVKNLYINLKWWGYVIFILQSIINMYVIFVMPRLALIGVIMGFFIFAFPKIVTSIIKFFKK